MFNLSRQRQLDTGEIVGPGGYVDEPAQNVDSWKAVGNEPVIVHIVSFGAMEYLGDDDQILRRDTVASLREIYLRYWSRKAADGLRWISTTRDKHA